MAKMNSHIIVKSFRKHKHSKVMGSMNILGEAEYIISPNLGMSDSHNYRKCIRKHRQFPGSGLQFGFKTHAIPNVQNVQIPIK